MLKLISLIPGKVWGSLGMAMVVMAGFLYVDQMRHDLAEAQDELKEQRRLVEQWKYANSAWEQAYTQQADYITKMQQKKAARDKGYVEARAKTNRQLQELSNAPDPNNVLDVNLGDAFWLPIRERANTYNSATGLRTD